MKTKYDLLKFIAVHVDPKTRKFIDKEGLIRQFLNNDGLTESEYLTDLQNEGFIRVTMNHTIEILSAGLELLKNL